MLLADRSCTLVDEHDHLPRENGQHSALSADNCPPGLQTRLGDASSGLESDARESVADGPVEGRAGGAQAPDDGLRGLSPSASAMALVFDLW